MRTLFTATAVLGALAFVAATSIQPVRGQQTSSIMTVTFGSSQVALDNRSDTSVLETVYDTTGVIKHVARSWCVASHTTDKETFKVQVSQVRVQVMHAGCSGSVMLDETIPWGNGSFAVTGHRGHYRFSQP
jgi:hypothetical protein